MNTFRGWMEIKRIDLGDPKYDAQSLFGLFKESVHSSVRGTARAFHLDHIVAWLIESQGFNVFSEVGETEMQTYADFAFLLLKEWEDYCLIKYVVVCDGDRTKIEFIIC